MKRAFTQFLSNRGGGPAVEFAVIAPILILMMGATFEGGILFYSRATIETYAREAARGVALGYMTPAQAQTFAETNAEASLSTPVTAVVTPASPPGNMNVVATVSVEADDLDDVLPFGVFGYLDQSVTVTMRSVTS